MKLAQLSLSCFGGYKIFPPPYLYWYILSFISQNKLYDELAVMERKVCLFTGGAVHLGV